MNEFELIERYFRRPPQHPDVRVGIGDDGAVVAPLPGIEYVMTVDMLVEGRHFVTGTDPARLGHKTLAVNLSDLAAMGALPRFALLAVALPDADPAWVAAFMRGFDALARRHDVELIGGDTTRGPRNLCVTAIGALPAGSALLRSGARAGDAIYVSGTLGDAALALAVADGRADVEPRSRAALALRLDAPEPRVALGVALRGIASAAIDVSDGLIGDLGHILTESQVGATVDIASVPCSPALRAAGNARAHRCIGTRARAAPDDDRIDRRRGGAADSRRAGAAAIPAARGVRSLPMSSAGPGCNPRRSHS